VGRGTGLSTASTTASSLATPLAAIGRGLDRLTPGQRKVADLRRALAAETAEQVGTPGSPLATQAYPAGGRVSPTNGSRIPVETKKTPPVPSGISAKNKTKRPATVVPTLNGIAPDAPPATQAALTVASILDASAAPFVPRSTFLTPSMGHLRVPLEPTPNTECGAVCRATAILKNWLAIVKNLSATN
jgi:hypothetical protein